VAREICGGAVTWGHPAAPAAKQSLLRARASCRPRPLCVTLPSATHTETALINDAILLPEKPLSEYPLDDKVFDGMPRMQGAEYNVHMVKVGCVATLLRLLGVLRGSAVAC